MSKSHQTDLNESTSVTTFRRAVPEDGLAVWRLVDQAGTLELNTAYFYILFCTDFADTCLVAHQRGRLVGAIIGYRPPNESDTLFCWQICVHPDCRGQGLGKRMLKAWLSLPCNRSVQWVSATVADDNLPSDRLFRRFAKELGVQCQTTPHFTEDLLPAGHRPEPLYRIGPIAR